VSPSYSFLGIAGPFIATVLFFGLGVGAAYLLRSRYSNQQIADERGTAGLLLIATIGSFVFALIALAIGAYAALVCCILPA
jgi:hypothetical protein